LDNIFIPSNVGLKESFIGVGSEYGPSLAKHASRWRAFYFTPESRAVGLACYAPALASATIEWTKACKLALLTFRAKWQL